MSTGRIRRPRLITAAALLVVLILAAGVSAYDTKGTVAISSNPSGAEVYLNDEFVGHTDIRISDLYPGIHYVRLEMPGYKSWEKIFEIKESETTYVTHNFETSTGDVFSINTEPDGAEIYIDGEFQAYSDTVLLKVPAGQHEVTLVLDGYSDYRKTVYIQEDMSQSLTHVFEPLPTTGTVIVESLPSNADVFLDGEFKGRTRLTLEKVQPGTYSILVKNEGFEDWEGLVEVAAGKISDVYADLSAMKVAVTINTAPEGATVFFDGEEIGKTPLDFMAGQGEHELLITKFGYADLSERIELGYEGGNFFYELAAMINEAIADAEAAISANSEYDPAGAVSALEKAKAAYYGGDNEGALSWAQEALRLAEDIDGDGVPNRTDMAPGLNNIVIYILPVFILIALLGLFVRDFGRHLIKPVLEIGIPASIDPDEKNPKAVVSIEIDGPYRGHVCTISIDGDEVDYISDTGSFNIDLAGRMPGLHKIEAKLDIAKQRYGTKTVTASKVFEIGSDIIVAEEYME